MERLLVRFADLQPWQIGLVAAGLLLQSCIPPGLPEELVVATLGILWGQGRIEFGTALASVLLGLLPANAAAVLAGGRLAPWLWRSRAFARALRSDAVSRALAALRRNAVAVVVATRFTPLVRGPVYLAAGLSGMGLARFVGLDFLAACIHIPLLLWAGNRLGRGAGSMVLAFQRLGWAALALLGVAGVVALLRHARERVAGAGRAGEAP
jgi:membrane protein DedA with SNARE-associated domain